MTTFVHRAPGASAVTHPADRWSSTVPGSRLAARAEDGAPPRLPGVSVGAPAGDDWPVRQVRGAAGEVSVYYDIDRAA